VQIVPSEIFLKLIILNSIQTAKPSSLSPLQASMLALAWRIAGTDNAAPITCDCLQLFGKHFLLLDDTPTGEKHLAQKKRHEIRR